MSGYPGDGAGGGGVRRPMTREGLTTHIIGGPMIGPKPAKPTITVEQMIERRDLPTQRQVNVAAAAAALFGAMAVFASYAVKGTPQDHPVAWAIRHPVVTINLLRDPPPPPNAPVLQGGAWLFLHASDAATMFADPPPKGN
jgi:hypothetical protein